MATLQEGSEPRIGQGRTTIGGIASKTHLRWKGPEARISGGRAGMGTQCDIGAGPRDKTAVPLVRPSAHHQGP